MERSVDRIQAGAWTAVDASVFYRWEKDEVPRSVQARPRAPAQYDEAPGRRPRPSCPEHSNAYPPAWLLPPCAAMNMATADRQ